MTAAMKRNELEKSASAPAAVDKAPRNYLSPLLCGFAPLRDSIIGQGAKPERPEFQRR
jgi:hypothetical protein